LIEGTGSVRVSNYLTGSREITALYIYIQGSGYKGGNVLDGRWLYYCEDHLEKGVNPGDYTIEAQIDEGADTAVENITVEEGVIDIVWITDSDIIYPGGSRGGRAVFLKMVTPKAPKTSVVSRREIV